MTAITQAHLDIDTASRVPMGTSAFERGSNAPASLTTEDAKDAEALCIRQDLPPCQDPTTLQASGVDADQDEHHATFNLPVLYVPPTTTTKTTDKERPDEVNVY